MESCYIRSASARKNPVIPVAINTVMVMIPAKIRTAKIFLP